MVGLMESLKGVRKDAKFWESGESIVGGMLKMDAVTATILYCLSASACDV